jgi:hypothetical protein
VLVLAATFVPAIAETVDLQKLPPPEVVTRHLSPLVLSQAYETDGYVTESVGPVSVYHAGLGVAIAAGFANSFDLLSGPPTSAPDDEPDGGATPLSAAPSSSPTSGPR